MTSYHASDILDAMGKTYILLLLAGFFLIFPSLAWSFGGPLQVKNQYPIFIHADQPYLEKALMENSFSASLYHSSTYTVNTTGEWIFGLDMEITEFGLRYRRIIRDFIELNIDVPVLIFSDGFMDGFLDSYHDAFNFPDYGRSARPNNKFLYEVRRNNILIVKGETGIGLGDIRLSVKKSLFSENNFNFGIKGDVEFPTGSSEKGYGNGNVDAAVGILLDYKVNAFIMTYWNFGAVFPGDVSGYQKIELNNYLYGGGGVEVDAGKNIFLLVQVQGQSSIYPETGLKPVDRPAYLLVFGGRYESGGNSVELSLAEDISESGAPDFIISLSYKRKL